MFATLYQKNFVGSARFTGRCAFAAASSCEEKRGTGGDKPYGDYLTYAKSPKRRPGVTAEELHAKTDDAVSREIRGTRVAAALKVEREKKRKKDKKRGGLEKLRRENRDHALPMLVPARGELRKDDRAPRVRILAIAAAVEETTDAAAGMILSLYYRPI